MGHPSIFELRHFAVTGELDEFQVPHLSTCNACATRLQRLAKTELRARGFEAAAVRVNRPGLAAAMPAFLAVAATMLVLAVVRPVVAHSAVSFDSSAVEPEGVHGMPSVRANERAPAWVDGGAAFGSE